MLLMFFMAAMISWLIMIGSGTASFSMVSTGCRDSLSKLSISARIPLVALSSLSLSLLLEESPLSLDTCSATLGSSASSGFSTSSSVALMSIPSTTSID